MEPEINRTSMDPYFQAMINIMFTGHWLTDHINRVLKPYGISEPQFNVLRILQDAGKKPLAQQDIGAQMIQKSSNVGRIIDKLVEKEFVTRTINPDNRRKMDIKLTSKGTKFTQKTSKAVLSFHDSIKGRISDRESLQMAKAARKLRQG